VSIRDHLAVVDDPPIRLAVAVAEHVSSSAARRHRARVGDAGARRHEKAATASGDRIALVDHAR